MEEFISKTMEDKKQIVLDLVNEKSYKPMKLKEIAILLDVKKENREDLKEVLDALIAEGKVTISSKEKYRKSDLTGLVGSFWATKSGFGFVKVVDEENPEAEPIEIFVPKDDTHGAFHEDTVLVTIVKKAEGEDEKDTGKIVKVLQRAHTEFIGNFQNNKTCGFVILDNPKYNQDIFVEGRNSMEAKTGSKVVVKVTSFGDGKRKKPSGKIVEILGDASELETEIKAVRRTYEFTPEFPAEVQAQIKSIPDDVQPTEMVGRKDLRNLTMVTIDGLDSKDLDDAVSLTVSEDGIYHLGVHIADVSHYVTENTPLDEEAYKRGTSCYMPDMVIPMLPKKLSNGICSLNEGVNRLAMTCFVDIDSKGKVVGHEICASVINVDKRMNYDSVQRVFDGNPEEDYLPYVDLLMKMHELQDILNEVRMKNGTIDFEFSETKIVLDENCNPIDIHPYDRTQATMMIEEFMLMANATVAEHFFWKEVPFLYRTHDIPDEDRITELKGNLSALAIILHQEGDEHGIHPGKLAEVLRKVKGTDKEALVSTMVLRSMKQAHYTVTADGHFGLAMKYYSHFTSPIRRYPDLYINRIIKEQLHGELDEKRMDHFREIGDGVATSTSENERRAVDAERDANKIMMAAYMKKYVGEVFSGIITGVTSWGIYVRLENTVEGLVSVRSMKDDYYVYDEEHRILIGEANRKVFRIGDPCLVKVDASDVRLRAIDFSLVEEEK